MSLQNRHIIQKQFIEVEMQKPPDAFAFRNRLGELYYQRILPGLENVFDEIGTEHKLIRKDLLDIDVGVIPSGNWEELFVAGAIRKIKEALSLESGISLKVNVSGKSSEVDTAKANSKIDTQNVEDILFFFLKNGFLPWYVIAGYDLEKELVVWINEQPSSFKSSFYYFLESRDRKIFLRFIYQFDDEILNRIVSLVVDEELWKEIKHYERGIKTSLRIITSDTSTRRRLFYYPLLQAALFRQSDPVKIYLFSLIDEIQAEKPAVARETILKEIAKRIVQDTTDKAKFKTGKAGKLSSGIDQLLFTDVLPPKKEVDKVIQAKKVETEIEGIYIQNAGLVILHPFLPLFFGHIGLTDDKNNFKDETSHQKAVLLSQYLVTGGTNIPEETIVLNKIVCGYPLEEPIDKELQLSELEIDEANDLLSQVIQSWKMSGVPVNNKVEGLQESFLQRAGKLAQKEYDWLLQVKQKPYDMVLSSLPWSIGIIKNSWMKGMLWVEWA